MLPLNLHCPITYTSDAGSKALGASHKYNTAIFLLIAVTVILFVLWPVAQICHLKSETRES
jgi:hypothetical protein